MSEKTTIGILTDPGIGGTFLSWSLYFLSGHDKYFNLKKSQWENLCRTPLTPINSHNFEPNQANSIDELTGIINTVESADTIDYHVIYFHNFLNTPAVDTETAVKNSVEKFSKILVVSNELVPLYQCKYQSRSLGFKFSNPQVRNNNWDEQHSEFINYFFSESKEKWEKLSLDNIWDYREFLALNLRPFDHLHITPYIDSRCNYFYIEAMDLWTNLDLIINDIFSYIEVDIEQKRLNEWKDVYDAWKKIHYDRLRFSFYFNKIIKNILDGVDMDLRRFNLDIVREAAIQHTLIYQHNLNFKTFNLEKLENTQQLHYLLEPNFHNVQSYNT